MAREEVVNQGGQGTQASMPSEPPGRQAEAGPSPQRRRTTAAFSHLLGRLLSPAARQRGFAAVAVLEEWPVIVGVGLARRCQPLRLEFRRGTTAGGTLVLQAAGGAALELQHVAPQLMERVNDYFGFRAVARLKVVQMPFRPDPPPPAAPHRRKLTEAEEALVASMVAPIEDPALGAALGALGRSIKSRDRAD